MQSQFQKAAWFSFVLAGLVPAWLGVPMAFGQSDAQKESAQSVTVIENTIDAPPGSETLLIELKKALPNLPISDVFETPVPGLYGIDLPGGQTLYGTKSGQFVISGDMYQLGQSMVNLTEERRAVGRKKIMDRVPLEEMVVFSPSGEVKTHINVFTDVDCSYCRKLHQEMAEINALGIEVRYLAYPRRGLDNETYDRIVSAWCAKNPNDAITELKAGRNIAQATCENPVADQYQLGQEVGVTGTPAIVTASGQLFPGYLPAAELAARIGIE